jgi:hypothetical protein
MYVTKYFVPLIETMGDVQTLEWTNIKGFVLRCPLLIYEALVCFPNSHASHINFLLSTLIIISGNALHIVSKDI